MIFPILYLYSHWYCSKKLRDLETKKKKDALDDMTYRLKVARIREALENKLVVTVYFGDLVTRLV
jgi:hypothetical protein